MAQEDLLEEKKNKVALNILTMSRNSLIVSLRFLDTALSMLEYVKDSSQGISTDGKHLFYDPDYVLSSYKRDQAEPVRQYLHMVLHCVFRHMYGAPNMDVQLWDLSCDMAVEATISDLELKSLSTADEKRQKTVISSLKRKLKVLTAEKVYSYYKEHPLAEIELQKLSRIFRADDHEKWYAVPENTQSFLLSNSKNRSVGLVQSGAGGILANQLANPGGKESSEIWKDIAEKMQMDLKTFSRKHADTAGALTQNLAAVNRERYDYTEFLKKFAVRKEIMKVNDDEFDYIFYTYGLKLYKKIPLIEPLEYKEEKKIKDFVIAIDTSGSVSGETVQAFIQKTYNILMSTESFFDKINLHIVQCDAAVQEHVKIENKKQFDTYLKTMQIKGLGGTDFRPVFRFVDDMLAKKEFENLKGLIYFTDGNGQFPKKKPAYDTAFVYIDSEYNNPQVPDWVIRLVLQKEEI